MARKLDEQPTTSEPVTTITEGADSRMLGTRNEKQRWHQRPMALALAWAVGAGAVTAAGAVGIAVNRDSGSNTANGATGKGRIISPPEVAETETPGEIMTDLILKRHLGLCNADAQKLREVYVDESHTRLQLDMEYIARYPNATCTTVASIGGEPINVEEGIDPETGAEALRFDYIYVDYQGKLRWQHAELINTDHWRIVSIENIGEQSDNSGGDRPPAVP